MTKQISPELLAGNPHYIRRNLNEETIQSYADAWRDAGKWPFPPIIVTPIPKEDTESRADGKTFFVIDGLHRTGAALVLKKPVTAEIREFGSEAEIVACQLKENVGGRGLVPTAGERRDACLKMKSLNLTQTDIARMTGISQGTVSRLFSSAPASKRREGFDVEDWVIRLSRIIRAYDKYAKIITEQVTKKKVELSMEELDALNVLLDHHVARKNAKA